MINDHYITTKEAMKLCRVKSYQAFSNILAERNIERLWKCGEGNIYRRDDFLFGKDSPQESGFANV